MLCLGKLFLKKLFFFVNRQINKFLVFSVFFSNILVERQDKILVERQDRHSRREIHLKKIMNIFVNVSSWIYK